MPSAPTPTRYADDAVLRVITNQTLTGQIALREASALRFMTITSVRPSYKYSKAEVLLMDLRQVGEFTDNLFAHSH